MERYLYTLEVYTMLSEDLSYSVTLRSHEVWGGKLPLQLGEFHTYDEDFVYFYLLGFGSQEIDTKQLSKELSELLGDRRVDHDRHLEHIVEEAMRFLRENGFIV